MGEGSEEKRTKGNFQAWTWVDGALVEMEKTRTGDAGEIVSGFIIKIIIIGMLMLLRPSSGRVC